MLNRSADLSVFMWFYTRKKILNRRGVCLILGNSVGRIMGQVDENRLHGFLYNSVLGGYLAKQIETKQEIISNLFWPGEGNLHVWTVNKIYEYHFIQHEISCIVTANHKRVFLKTANPLCVHYPLNFNTGRRWGIIRSQRDGAVLY